MPGAMREPLRELMAAPPAEFVAVRTRLARSGLRELAKVRKPPLKLWAANAAVVSRPDAAGKLAAATLRLHELEAAIARGEKGAGAALREAAADQKRQLHVLETEAAQHAAGAAAEAREIIRRAAVAGGQTWEDLRDGVLFDEPAALEESVFGLAPDALPRPDRARPREESQNRRWQEEARELRAEAERLEREADQLESEARRARSRAEAAAARADDAEARL